MFEQYVSKGKSTFGIRYDLLIGDALGKEWYDSSDKLDLREWLWCVKHLRSGMCVADCGAHHGCASVIFAKAVGPTGRVHAFEALPPNAEIAARNFEINRCANATARAVALTQSKGPLRLGLGDDGKTAYLCEGENIMEVEGSTLDIELPEGADFLKIDVEGSEVELLRGARRALRRRPIIDLELHNFLFSDPRRALEEIFGALDALGYCYAWLKAPFEGEVEALGWRVDLAELAEAPNPHVFCLPVDPGGPKRSWRARLGF